MKTIRFNNIFNLIVPVVLIALLGLVSCKKEEEQSGPTRLFTPGGGLKITSGETDVQLTWNAALYTTGKDITYTVQISKDSLFSTVAETFTTNTPGLVITDEKIGVTEKYFARIKTNATATEEESKWFTTPSFSIKGIFAPIAPANIKDKNVLLKWSNNAGLTKIVLTPKTPGTPIEVALTAQDDGTAGKLIKGLAPETNYLAEIFAGSKLKGNIAFKTKELSLFTVILKPGDDLAAAVAAAENGDVIGLENGTYDLKDGSGSYAALNIAGKTLTIQSVNGDPKLTTVNFKDINLKGTGAGLKVSGIRWDGTTGGASYFINLFGLNNDADAANFTSITIDNSIINSTANCLIRANRAANNAHKLDFIKITNSIAYGNGSGTYHYFMLDKLEFKSIEIKNSTFYDIARAFISWATNLTVPSRPKILIDQVTMNNFGFGDRDNILVDANGNAIDFTMQNSIIANTPKPGQAIKTGLFRAALGGEMKFTNNNSFNLNGGAPLVPLTFPSYVQQSNNKNVDLGWTATTTQFKLPAVSELRTAGTTGGAIGDPRWH